MLDQLKVIYKKLVQDKLVINEKIEAIENAIVKFGEEPAPAHKKVGRPKGSKNPKKVKVVKVKRAYKKRVKPDASFLSMMPVPRAETAPKVSMKDDIREALVNHSMDIGSIQAVLSSHGYKESSIMQIIKRMYGRGEIVRVARGVYALPAQTPPTSVVANGATVAA